VQNFEREIDFFNPTRARFWIFWLDFLTFLPCVCVRVILRVRVLACFLAFFVLLCY